MDDLAGKLNEILNNPAEMAKFQQMANSLLGQMNTGQENNTQQQPAQTSTQQPAQGQTPQNNSNGGGFDLSQLSGLLGQQSNSAQAQQNNNPLGALGNLGGLGNALGALSGNGGGGLGNALGALSGNGGGGLGNALGALSGNGGGGLGNALGALSGNGGGIGNALGGLGGNGTSPEMLNTIMKIAPLLGNLNQEDDNTRLLNALRPLLKSERQKKLDEAIKIMRMLKFLPILKEQGILQGIL